MPPSPDRALICPALGPSPRCSPWGPNPGHAVTIMDEGDEGEAAGALGHENSSPLCHALRLQASARIDLPTLDPRWGVPLSAVPDSKQSFVSAPWFSVRAKPGRTVVGCVACAASKEAGRTGGRWAFT